MMQLKKQTSSAAVDAFYFSTANYFKVKVLCMNSSFDQQLKALIQSALQEDIGDGDHSTLSCFNQEQQGKAVLLIKEDGILAGMEVARTIFEMVEPSATFLPLKADGDQMKSGEKAFEVKASVQTLLKCERLVLNCMQRMSGIATLTRKYVDLVKGYHATILDTRKTTPNFRLLEKEAVRIGGGENHRFGLFDMIMLKDNHIDFAGGLIPAIEKAFQYVNSKRPGLKIEVETRNLNEVKTVLDAAADKVDRIMLDNFSPSDAARAVTLIGGRVETEASGGINIDTVASYAATGVDYISVGGLIHQARSLDLSLKASVVN